MLMDYILALCPSCQALGYVTGVKYLDQVESDLLQRYKMSPPRSTKNTTTASPAADYSLLDDFEGQPRRGLHQKTNNEADMAAKEKERRSLKFPKFFPARIYMRKVGRLIKYL